MLVVRNDDLLGLLRQEYSLPDLRRLWQTLCGRGVLEFPHFKNGLFPAAAVTAENRYTGYASVWVRDNVFVAYAQQAMGRGEAAALTASTLLEHFRGQAGRFQAIIAGRDDPQNAMCRPHIRFDGRTLREIDIRWPHAQNDALGYFLWLYGTLAGEGLLAPGSRDRKTLGLFPKYLRAIRYWKDQDSGHWEETRKISASSIGAVVAGLRQLRRVCDVPGAGLIEQLIEKGETALRAILPWECVQAEAGQRRRYDAALLFLAYPLEVIDGAMARRVMADVARKLEGDYGIRRYLGDSFWAPEYKKKVPPQRRTQDVSGDLGRRNALARKGAEAQWCIFDPIVSAIHGRNYRRTRSPRLLEAQVHHFNRAIGQVTGAGGAGPAWKCPEAYYLEDGRYIANDATPLLWTQANLCLAFKEMFASLGDMDWKGFAAGTAVT